MGAKKQGKGGIPPGPPKTKEVASMIIRKEISAEEFKKAYGKYNYAKQAR